MIDEEAQRILRLYPFLVAGLQMLLAQHGRSELRVSTFDRDMRLNMLAIEEGSGMVVFVDRSQEMGS